MLKRVMSRLSSSKPWIQIRNDTTGSVIFEGRARDKSELTLRALQNGHSLSNANLSGVHISHCTINRAMLRNAKLSSAQFDDVSFVSGNFAGSDLSFSKFNECKFLHTNFQRCVSISATMRHCYNVEISENRMACHADEARLLLIV